MSTTHLAILSEYVHTQYNMHDSYYVHVLQIAVARARRRRTCRWIVEANASSTLAPSLMQLDIYIHHISHIITLKIILACVCVYLRMLYRCFDHLLEQSRLDGVDQLHLFDAINKHGWFRSTITALTGILLRTSISMIQPKKRLNRSTPHRSIPFGRTYIF